MLMDRLGFGKTATVHGFRSAFRDWISEETNFPNIVGEMALGHSIPDKTEAAYRRGTLLQKRRQLMAAWERYLAKPQQRSGGEVVSNGPGASCEEQGQGPPPSTIGILVSRTEVDP